MSALPVPDLTLDALSDGDGHAIELYDVTLAFGDKAVPWVMRAEWWIQPNGDLLFAAPVMLPDEVASWCDCGHELAAHWATGNACTMCQCEGFKGTP